jgi:hypothetical protein
MRGYSFRKGQVDTPEKADFLHRALNQTTPLTEAERLRFIYVLGVALGTHEAAFNLRMRKLVEIGAYDRVESNTRLYMQSPAVRKSWRRIRLRGFDPRFRDLIDGMVKEIETPARTASAPNDQD